MVVSGGGTPEGCHAIPQRSGVPFHAVLHGRAPMSDGAEVPVHLSHQRITPWPSARPTVNGETGAPPSNVFSAWARRNRFGQAASVG